MPYRYSVEQLQGRMTKEQCHRNMWLSHTIEETPSLNLPAGEPCSTFQLVVRKTTSEDDWTASRVESLQLMFLLSAVQPSTPKITV